MSPPPTGWRDSALHQCECPDRELTIPRCRCLIASACTGNVAARFYSSRQPSARGSSAISCTSKPSLTCPRIDTPRSSNSHLPADDYGPKPRRSSRMSSGTNRRLTARMVRFSRVGACDAHGTTSPTGASPLHAHISSLRFVLRWVDVRNAVPQRVATKLLDNRRLSTERLVNGCRTVMLSPRCRGRWEHDVRIDWSPYNVRASAQICRRRAHVT